MFHTDVYRDGTLIRWWNCWATQRGRKDSGRRLWVRFVQELDPARIPFGEPCRFSLSGACASASDRIEWAAILSRRGGGKRVFHTRVFDTLTFPPGGGEAIRNVRIGPASDATRYFFVLQLSGRTADIALRACGMRAESAPASPILAPRMRLLLPPKLREFARVAIAGGH